MTLRLSRRHFVAGSAAGAAAISLGIGRTAFGQEFPAGNIDITIPTGEGGGADRDARTFTQVWRKYLDRNFEFGYFPGAAGQVRSEERRVGDECVSTCTSRCAREH